MHQSCLYDWHGLWVQDRPSVCISRTCMISMSCEGTSRACTIDIGTWHVLCVHISNRSPLGPPQPRAPCRSMPAAKKAAAPAVLPDRSLLAAAYNEAEARPTKRRRAAPPVQDMVQKAIHHNFKGFTAPEIYGTLIRGVSLRQKITEYTVKHVAKRARWRWAGFTTTTSKPHTAATRAQGSPCKPWARRCL